MLAAPRSISGETVGADTAARRSAAAPVNPSAARICRMSRRVTAGVWDAASMSPPVKTLPAGRTSKPMTGGLYSLLMPVDVAAVQEALRAEGLDGWLLYDFQGSNPIASRL